mmetsp:Transcript_55915/g.173352  ORF Transcript_55915/g.173352 Transcript_55915/m.173352 type:complete len:330 (-) Transcript_55915:17-1006(-)
MFHSAPLEDGHAHYGATPDRESMEAEETVKSLEQRVEAFERKLRSSKQAMSLIVLAVCLVVPWLFFMVAYAVMSFSIHYSSSQLCLIVNILLLVVIGAMGCLAGVSLRTPTVSCRDTSWLMFLFGTSFLLWLAGFIFGEWNYQTNSYPLYELQQLNVYSSVDPNTYRGIQLADAGRVTFDAGSHLDLSRSMGFKNLNTYCVAPVVGPPSSSAYNVSSYDFWAIGLDCCSGQGPDFRCGEWNNPKAHAGLRLVRESQKGYFRLAVQQAEAAFNIKARHPVFLYWVEDPLAEMNALSEDGQQYFLLGLGGAFLGQLALLILVAVGISKIRS